LDFIIIGGLFEVGFASCLGKANETKESNLLIGCWVLLCLSISMLLLYKATQELLVLLSGLDWYWSCGTVLVGIVVFKEPATFGEFSFDDFNYFYCWVKICFQSLES
jgi:quaternary ammonium compound-resistance protein SugE